MTEQKKKKQSHSTKPAPEVIPSTQSSSISASMEDGGDNQASGAYAKDKMAKSINAPEEAEAEIPEVLNEKALTITQRISNKLTGKDFVKDTKATEKSQTLDVNQQVQRLIKQATDVENLCQSYLGWSPYW